MQLCMNPNHSESSVTSSRDAFKCAEKVVVLCGSFKGRRLRSGGKTQCAQVASACSLLTLEFPSNLQTRYKLTTRWGTSARFGGDPLVACSLGWSPLGERRFLLARPARNAIWVCTYLLYDYIPSKLNWQAREARKLRRLTESVAPCRRCWGRRCWCYRVPLAGLDARLRQQFRDSLFWGKKLSRPQREGAREREIQTERKRQSVDFELSSSLLRATAGEFVVFIVFIFNSACLPSAAVRTSQTTTSKRRSDT